jgi:hypothetical protein
MLAGDTVVGEELLQMLRYVVLKPAFQHAFVDQLAKIPERLAGVGKAFSPKAWISPLSMMPPCMTRLLMG